MSGVDKSNQLVQEYRLDAPLEKVWRAISIAEYREVWLPNAALADGQPVACEPGKSIRYRLRDDAPPYLESDVTFLVKPDEVGGTLLTIVHRINDPHLLAANDEHGPLMLAA
ncbi:polyketide cyclase [Pantoea rodasii]|uniref:Polyketide cyclase n=1 Tax=Pantoea rodasii TaxID=1076549 RepID=A0A2M9W6K3_9GAMM|nr:polyketide cyclase [Pantoea rodasii]ORM62782.1 polyketide cyclase [Pantoea rodasii]PJZ03176.1 polyketide cyclase [Pantoea rodasii]